MSLVINTNATSLNAQRLLSQNTTSLNKVMERLASGYRINRAGDDAAGLQVSENLRTQIRGLKKAQDNAQDGINVMNVADGAMSVIGDNLQRMRELAVQAANDTYDATQRTAIANEIAQRAADITRISDATSFNGTNLLDGSAPAAFNIQVGAGDTAGIDDINIGSVFGDFSATGAVLGLAGALTVGTHAQALATITDIDVAINALNDRRADLGSFVNQMESAIQNIQVGVENLSASESRVRNADVALESSELVRFQILQQASATILAQANQAPGLALKLIGG